MQPSPMAETSRFFPSLRLCMDAPSRCQTSSCKWCALAFCFIGGLSQPSLVEGINLLAEVFWKEWRGRRDSERPGLLTSYKLLKIRYATFARFARNAEPGYMRGTPPTISPISRNLVLREQRLTKLQISPTIPAKSLAPPVQTD